MGFMLEKITTFFEDAKRYLANNSSTENLPFKATKGLFNGSQKLFIHVNGEKEITDAINKCKNVKDADSIYQDMCNKSQ